MTMRFSDVFHVGLNRKKKKKNLADQLFTLFITSCSSQIFAYARRRRSFAVVVIITITINNNNNIIRYNHNIIILLFSLQIHGRLLSRLQQLWASIANKFKNSVSTTKFLFIIYFIIISCFFAFRFKTYLFLIRPARDYSSRFLLLLLLL